jgi:Bacterial toxin of type II toxin-antitoxin system, YafQ
VGKGALFRAVPTRAARVERRGHASLCPPYGDCHIKPDLVLIYRKPNAENLELVRIGSHSELGL